MLKWSIDQVINKLISMSYGEHEEVNTAGEDHMQAYASSLLNLDLFLLHGLNGSK